MARKRKAPMVRREPGESTEAEVPETPAAEAFPEPPPDFRSFLYSAEGERLFVGAEITAALRAGWVDHPGKVNRSQNSESGEV